nr:MAG TPA: hypothetical protein [Caudoviricetes sp.]
MQCISTCTYIICKSYSLVKIFAKNFLKKNLERVIICLQNPNNGHTSQNWQCSERVMGRVDSWIKENRNPDIISTTKRKYSIA